MKERRTLDVFLNGSRDYVQGTQMLARGAEALAAATGLPHADFTLQEAAFRRITDRQVEALVLPAGVRPERDALGTARFDDGHGDRRSVVFHALEGQAPRADLPPRATWTPLPGTNPGANPLTASFEIAGLQDCEDLLVALIQTIKMGHEALPTEVHDIWFTGLRSGHIPFGIQGDGRLELSFERFIGRNGVYQSLQTAKLCDVQDRTLASAVISFAFKSEELPHVA